MRSKRIRVFSIGVLGGVAALLAFGHSETRAWDRRDLSKLLEPIRSGADLPGLAAVVVRGDEVVAAGATGIRMHGYPEKLTVDDEFHLGSCTKSMTATMIAMLVQEKKLSWSTKVSEVFTDLKKSMHEDWQSVTLEQLLTNRSGAPGDLTKDALWGKLWTLTDKPPPAQRRALVEGVLAKAPEAPPGTKYIYSNAGFSIAGAMAERVTGEAWEDLMRKRIFEPLGMKSAGFGAPGTKETRDQPRGHKADGSAVEPGPSADNPAAIGPAGIVHATLLDWAKYVSLHLRLDPDGTGKAPRGSDKLLALLKPQAFEKLHAPAEGSDPKDPRYAMGWIVCDRDWAGGKTLTHSGSNTMWYVVAWLAPKKDFAVLVGTNQGGDKPAKACDDAAWAVIQDEVKSRK